MIGVDHMTRVLRPRAATRRVPWGPAPYLVALLLALAAGALAVTLGAYLRGAWGYVDNGDGYYLYAARRVAQGAVLYRDVMGTQPPLVYLLGAAVFKLGGSVTTMRLVSAAMRALTTLLVFLVGRRLFGDGPTAALAALVYTLLPLGLTWDRSFDVNPPVTLLALLALWPLLRRTPRAALLAGALAALAVFTKNLYLPLLATTLAVVALRHRRLLVPYVQGLALGLVALSLALWWYAGWSGLHDAFLGQDSSPLNTAWFVVSLRYVASVEGGVVLVALAGAALCSRAAYRGIVCGETSRWNRRLLAGHRCRLEASDSRNSTDTAAARGDNRDVAPWLLAGSCAVLLATLKEGTAWPVFQIAEPAVALLAAYAATWPWRTRLVRRRQMRGPLVVVAAALAAPVVLGCTLWGLATTGYATLDATNSAAVAHVAALVGAHAWPGATIVAPPYYAVLTGTRVPGDAADTYILAQRVRRGDPAAVRLIRRVDAALAAHRIPVVLTDLRLAAIAPLMATLQAHYRPVYSDALPPALHVVVWLPGASGPHR